MQKIEFVGSHQYCSPFAISITSSGRETVRPAASGGRNPSSHATGCNETGHGVDTGARPPTQPETLRHSAPRRCRVKGLKMAKVAKVANISGTGRYEFFIWDGRSPEPMSLRGCAVPYRCLNTRWRIFPVAVRGISSSRMNATDFGRL